MGGQSSATDTEEETTGQNAVVSTENVASMVEDTPRKSNIDIEL